MPTVLPDVRAIDAAILNLLTADPILAALMPGGVHWDIAPPAANKFVIVTLGDFAHELMQGDGGNERTDYLVKAIMRTNVADPVLDAAARIHDLLHFQTLDLSGSGYAQMILRRVRRVRYAEFVSNYTWHHIGGVYQIMVTVGTV